MPQWSKVALVVLLVLAVMGLGMLAGGAIVYATFDRDGRGGSAGNPELLGGQIRAEPHQGPDGNIDGYRLSGIEPGSIWDQIGVKNGDIVHSVNGKELTSMSEVMAAYTFQSAKSFTFEVTRDGQRQTMRYDVR